MMVGRMNEILIIRISSLFGHKCPLSEYEVIQCFVIGTLRGGVASISSDQQMMQKCRAIIYDAKVLVP